MPSVYKALPIQIAGPWYTSRSGQLASMKTINYYMEANQGAKTEYALMPFPGLRTVSNVLGVSRGMHQMVEVGYRVVGQKLYSFDSSGVHTELGDVPGTGRCIFDDDGINLFIVTDKNVYKYSSTTGTIANVTSVNIGSPNSVSYLNDKFVYDRGQGNDFAVSNVGAGDTVNSANIAGAISDPDDLLRCYAFRQTMWFYGSRTIEPWYDKGVGSPPLDRIDGQIQTVGLGAVYSLSSNDNAMYFLGDDRQVYQFNGAAKTRISSTAISNEIESYAKVSDAIGWCFTLQGHNFYAITFPSERKTWCVNEEFGQSGWFELRGGVGGGVYPATGLVWVYDKNWLEDATGNLLCLDVNYFENSGDPIERVRVLAPISGDLIGKPGQRLQISRVELIIEKGIGTIAGQGEDPKIMIEPSYDGGKTFNEGSWVRIGRLGEFTIKAEWDQVVSFYDLVLRIRITDPVFSSLHSAAVHIKEGGR